MMESFFITLLVGYIYWLLANTTIKTKTQPTWNRTGRIKRKKILAPAGVSLTILLSPSNPLCILPAQQILLFPNKLHFFTVKYLNLAYILSKTVILQKKLYIFLRSALRRKCRHLISKKSLKRFLNCIINYLH